MLGIFSDIPGHQLRESEVHAWARAGFTWVVCDGEHSLGEGRYGREQLAMMLRLGITPVQRLHREARSLHGDSLTMGARATMMPYGNTIQLIYHREPRVCNRLSDCTFRAASILGVHRKVRHLRESVGHLRPQRVTRSEHIQLNAVVFTFPTGTTVAESEEYYKCVSYPTVGAATPQDRGGFPMRYGDRTMLFTPDELKSLETETQGWIHTLT